MMGLLELQQWNSKVISSGTVDAMRMLIFEEEL